MFQDLAAEKWKHDEALGQIISDDQRRDQRRALIRRYLVMGRRLIELRLWEKFGDNEDETGVEAAQDVCEAAVEAIEEYTARWADGADVPDLEEWTKSMIHDRLRLEIVKEQGGRIELFHPKGTLRWLS